MDTFERPMPVEEQLKRTELTAHSQDSSCVL